MTPLQAWIAQASIVEVFERLGGTVKFNRGAAFWRGSTDLNIQLLPTKNAWIDYVDDQPNGKGIVALVMSAKECNKHEAVKWLEQQYGIGPNAEPQERLSPEEKRQAELWLAGYRQHLETRRAMLSAALQKHFERNEDPGPTLERDLRETTKRLAEAFSLSAARELIEAYRSHQKANPKLAQKLLEDQEQWEKRLAMAVGA